MNTKQKEDRKSLFFVTSKSNECFEKFCHPLNGSLTHQCNQMVCIGMKKCVKGSKMQKLDGSTDVFILT